MKITSAEIAKIANVSRSTVSRVINNYPNVPQDTREKILSIIKEHGYVPNTSARTLAGKHNNIISLFIADINESNDDSITWRGVNSPYFLSLIAETINECKKYNYMVLVNIITNKSEYEQIEHTFINRTIYGGIFVGFKYDTPEIKNLINKGYNMVLQDQLRICDENSSIKLVNSKNEEGAYRATQYLIDNGHRYIAHIAGDDRLSSIDRQNGYIKALKDNNIDDYFVYEGEYKEEVAYEVTKQLLQDKRITAIFSANDIMAIGIVKAVKDMNLRIPEDISIIGFDNSDFKNQMDMNLTTMEVSLKDIAKSSVKLIVEDCNERHIECEARIVEKDSVKKIN